MSEPTARRIAAVTLVVDSYDNAIAFFRSALGFELLEDRPLGGGKRWVRVAPSGAGTSLLLAEAKGSEQQAVIGRQAGGRVFLFLETDDLDLDLARLRAHGATIEAPPREEPYGRVVVFRDRWGNRWDLIEPSAPSAVTL